MVGNLLKNLLKSSVIFDKGTYCEYEFVLGKLYGFKRPKFYHSSAGTVTFYNAEVFFQEDGIEKFNAFIIEMQEILLFVGTLELTCIPYKKLYKPGYANNQIPCFLYKTFYIVPEYFVANNPTMFLKQL